MRSGTLLPPVRPLPAAAAGLRSEIREFLAAERAAGRFVPACDAWLSGWTSRSATASATVAGSA